MESRALRALVPTVPHEHAWRESFCGPGLEALRPLRHVAFHRARLTTSMAASGLSVVHAIEQWTARHRLVSAQVNRNTFPSGLELSMDEFEAKEARRQRRKVVALVKTPDNLPVVEMDRQNVFMVYLATSGDVARTAAECKIDAVALQRMVDEEQWKEKIQPIVTLKKNAKPKEIERMVNRTLNFGQITRMRMVLERAVKRLYDMNDQELFAQLFQETETTSKNGDKVVERIFSARGLTDLTSAIEKAHMMSYYALNDTTPDRARRLKEENDDSGPTSQEIHSAIADAMSKASASTSPRALVFDQQLAKAEQQNIEATLQAELVDAQT
jgi:hypothetical protein